MNTNEYQNCPYCDEKVKSMAIKCRHCKSMLNGNINKQESTESLTSDDAKKNIQKNNRANNYQSSSQNKKVGLIIAVIAGCFLIIVLAINIIDRSLGDDGSEVVVDDFDFQSLEALGANSRNITLGLLSQMHTHNNMGYRFWQQFLQESSSTDDPYIFEIIGEQFIDIINSQVLDSIVGTEGLIKGSVASEAWRNEAVRYYVNSSIELCRMKITYINILIEHNWTGEEDLLVKANQYEQTINDMQTHLNELYNELEDTLK